LADENGPLTFLHCANSDHHSIVLARAKAATLNHIAFEMPDLDSVMRGAGRMKDHGYPIEWGVGRHGPGNNVFAYFAGPDELPIEYTAEVLQVDDGHVARGTDYWKFPAGRSDQWGITGPRSARLMRIQDLFGFPAEGDAPA
jgi:catechol 2,3-dioxygenase-like lactoylglutathione lyase family enzyme